MAIVSEHDIERVARNNLDNGGAMARDSGEKACGVPHPHLNQSV